MEGRIGEDGSAAIWRRRRLEAAAGRLHADEERTRQGEAAVSAASTAAEVAAEVAAEATVGLLP